MNSHDIKELDHAQSVADDLIKEWRLEDALRPYESNRWKPDHEALPVLHLEDLTGIPFLDGVSGVQEYQHRARVRAGNGDIFAASTRPAEGYEDYCREMLGLGSPEFVHATDDNPMAVARSCFEPEILDQLNRHIEERGGMVIHPYMAIESVWTLARRLQQRSGAVVSVLGPPPPALWVANDKARFSQLVEALLGKEWIVETRQSSKPQELAEALGDLAQRCEQVGMKRTRCASAMGNIVFDAAELRETSPSERLKIVEEFLTRTRWCDDEDVLVVEWRDTDLSPSTQLWVPPIGAGPPVLDGVYEQLLDGPEKVFLGSSPSTLAEPLNQAMLDASLTVCTALQQMGYVGRCSFDFIVTGDPEGEFHAQFTECNGRWGGTSTPMHLVDRLIAHNGKRPSYVATDYFLPESHRDMAFTDLLAALDDLLYSPQNQRGRFILYNVGPMKEHGKFDVISLGKDPEDAQLGLDEVLPQQLGF